LKQSSIQSCGLLTIRSQNSTHSHARTQLLETLFTVDIAIDDMISDLEVEWGEVSADGQARLTGDPVQQQQQQQQQNKIRTKNKISNDKSPSNKAQMLQCNPLVRVDNSNCKDSFLGSFRSLPPPSHTHTHTYAHTHTRTHFSLGTDVRVGS
jgi:hypothetical protein